MNDVHVRRYHHIWSYSLVFVLLPQELQHPLRLPAPRGLFTELQKALRRRVAPQNLRFSTFPSLKEAFKARLGHL